MATRPGDIVYEPFSGSGSQKTRPVNAEHARVHAPWKA
jgi:hypothetical protein